MISQPQRNARWAHERCDMSEKKRDRTQAKVSEAALRLFVEQGIAGTRSREIAEAAEVSEGTIFRYYTSKEDLAWKLFESEYARFSESIAEIIALNKGFFDTWGLVVEFFCTEFDERPFAFRYILLSQHQNLSMLNEASQSPIRTLVGLFSRAIADGVIPKQDAALAVAKATGIITHAATFIIYDLLYAPLSQWKADLIASSTAAIRARPEGEASS